MVTSVSSVTPATTALPVSVTTNKDSRPVSVRTAPENEIDQLNNTPNAKKLYNAKVYGGIAGGTIALTAGVLGFIATRNVLPAHNITRKTLRSAILLAGAAISVPAARIASNVSHALTVFFSTRGESKVAQKESV